MKIWKQEEWLSSNVREKKADTKPGCGMDMEPNFETDLKPGDRTDAKMCPEVDFEEVKRARDKAVYYLQFSGKTESELRKKLAEQEFSPASVDSAIEFVKRYRYLDDEDFARRFVEKNGNKKSRKQMMYELSQKGVSRDILDMVFEDMPVDEEAQIMAILEKRKYPGEGASREEKQKISAYLARKGFSYDAISSALIQFARKTAD